MSSPWSPVSVTAKAPPRGGTQDEITFACQTLQITKAWGVSPATAVLTYVAEGNPIPAPVTAGAELTITSGGHIFWGECVQDSAADGSNGRQRTLEFRDFRSYLDYDYVFGAFNLPDRRLVNGQWTRRYKHLFPDDYYGNNWTYTNGPLTAAEILNAMFGADTVLTEWLRVYHADQANFPVYDVDCLSGKKLSAAVQEVSDRQGLVFTIMGGPFRLVWVRKGEGVLPAFPDNSDLRRTGVSLSGNPTRVQVVGERNLYQVANVPLARDWAAGWEKFVQFEVFADEIYRRGVNPKTGVAFASTPGDPEQYIGRQLAAARAKTITVREYVALSGDATFIDQRKFAGRSRMDMPAALYIRELLFRAFRPDLTSFQNVFGDGVGTLRLAERLLCRASHDPATGVMTLFPNEPADGNGFAIARGWQLGPEMFRGLRPEQFKLDMFTDAQSFWQPASFQIDDSGEGDQFLIFDEPIIVSENLLADVDGHKVINAGFTLSVPQVRAALVFEAERYVYFQGLLQRDQVENVPGLRGEYVIHANGVLEEVPFADGYYADEKAGEIADAILSKQYYYFGGGYTVRGTNATQLTSVIDRVTYSTGPNGTTEVVDFTTERGRNAFEPERVLDRRTREGELLPGQAQLQAESNEHLLLAEGFKQSRGFVKSLGELLGGTLSIDQPTDSVIIKSPGAATLPAGTPLRKASMTAATGNTPNTRTLAVMPAAATSEDKLFAGVTVRQNEKAALPVRLQMHGDGLALVKGPVNENDPVGLSGTASDGHLVSGGSPAVGQARQRISDSSVKLIPVRFGSGGGSGGLPTWLP